MTSSFNTLKIKMDGQEHELTNFELDNHLQSILFDIEDTVTVQVDDVQKLFDKEIEILKVGHDDQYTKARIDSFYVDSETNENRILGISF